jgi:hypothetical protein
MYVESSVSKERPKTDRGKNSNHNSNHHRLSPDSIPVNQEQNRD